MFTAQRHPTAMINSFTIWNILIVFTFINWNMSDAKTHERRHDGLQRKSRTNNTNVTSFAELEYNVTDDDVMTEEYNATSIQQAVRKNIIRSSGDKLAVNLNKFGHIRKEKCKTKPLKQVLAICCSSSKRVFRIVAENV